MKIIGLGQLVAGIIMILTGCVLAGEGGHALLAWINLGVGFWTLAGAIKDVPPPSDGAVAEVRG